MAELLMRAAARVGMSSRGGRRQLSLLQGWQEGGVTLLRGVGVQLCTHSHGRQRPKPRPAAWHSPPLCPV